MDAVVQLIRNALCCIKDLQLFSETSLHQPAPWLEELPHPLNQTSPLESVISVTQFYAFVSVSLSGYRLIFQSGYGKLNRIQKLIDKRVAPISIADKVVDESLQNEKMEAERSIFIGFNVLAIGLAFFWLFANSWHVTETNWIGGLPGLIQALTVMEIALLPLLYYMLSDAVDIIGRAARMEYLVSILRKCDANIPLEILNKETFKLLHTSGWQPFWSSGVFTNEIEDDVAEQKAFREELSNLTSSMNAMAKAEVGAQSMKATIQNTANRLEADVIEVRYQGYREFVYFFLNFIAFYGYMLGILAYYFDDDDELAPSTVRMLKLGMSNSDADWHGNFAGDLMWTIEPIVILASPVFFGWIKTKGKSSTKEKKD